METGALVPLAFFALVVLIVAITTLTKLHDKEMQVHQSLHLEELEHNRRMKEAGIREARQNLSALIAEVRKGHEVTITDRGKAVARLVPPRPADAKPFRGRAAFRRRMPQLTKPLSSAILDGRAERS